MVPRGRSPDVRTVARAGGDVKQRGTDAAGAVVPTRARWYTRGMGTRVCANEGCGRPARARGLCTMHYARWRKRAGLPVEAEFGEFWRALEWMGLQRHLKVLGIFARINYRDGKPKYLADTPRFLKYARDVSRRYAALAPLTKLLDELA